MSETKLYCFYCILFMQLELVKFPALPPVLEDSPTAQEQLALARRLFRTTICDC